MLARVVLLKVDSATPNRLTILPPRPTLPDQPLERGGAYLELGRHDWDGRAGLVLLDHLGDVVRGEPKRREVLARLPASGRQLLRLLVDRYWLDPLEASHGPSEVIEQVTPVRVPPQKLHSYSKSTPCGNMWSEP